MSGISTLICNETQSIFIGISPVTFDEYHVFNDSFMILSEFNKPDDLLSDNR